MRKAKRDVLFIVRMTRAEKAAIRRSARKRKLTLSEWARGRLVSTASFDADAGRAFAATAAFKCAHNVRRRACAKCVANPEPR